MVTLRNRAQAPENPSNHRIGENGRTQTRETQKVSDYEQFREERIRENLERMQKLGIFDLSLKFKSVKPTRKHNTKTPRPLSPLPPPGPVRRSSRLQNVTPVSYSEVNLKKKDASMEGDFDLLGEGSRPEAYTEEHEKLLCNTQMSWTLFIDGYGQDGRRIYDPVKGKTCHQCRQKTLGHRTHCSQCGLVQGQFCGDCLYMRYGEHVLEAKQNPNWICPVCRGICNCSLCRQAKGWLPTGVIYKRISQLGFKSVAHYLIQTQRAQTDSDKNPGARIPASVKRSLIFSDMEATSEEEISPVLENDQPGLVSPNEDKETDGEFKWEKREEMDFPENKPDATLTSAYSDIHQESSMPESENKKDSDTTVAPESSSKSKRKFSDTPEPNPDSIGGRLRQRRRVGSEQMEELTRTNDENLDVEEEAVKDEPSKPEAKGSMSQCASVNPGVESISGRLRLRKRT